MNADTVVNKNHDTVTKYDASPMGLLKRAESLHVSFLYLQKYKVIVTNDLLSTTSHQGKQLKPVAYTLLAYSLENIFKSELMRKNMDLVDVTAPGHELKMLHAKAFPKAKSAKLNNSFEKLSQFTMWAGRYPVPMDKNSYKSLDLSNEEIDLLVARYNEIKTDLLSML